MSAINNAPVFFSTYEVSMKAVFVTWQDAVSVDQWETLEEAQKIKLHTINTIGFLIHEDEKMYVVSHNLDTDSGAVSQYIAIPKAWIINVQDIPHKHE
jgi:hypothetical protein